MWTGEYQHSMRNMGVLSSGDGTLATYTRRNDELQREGSLGFFLKDNLWFPIKCCPFNAERTIFIKAQSQAKLLLQSSLDISERN